MEFWPAESRILYIKEGEEYLPVGCLTGINTSETSEVLETTTRSLNGWKTQKVTNQSYNIGFNGLQPKNTAGLATFELIRQKKRAREIIEWKISGVGSQDDTGEGQITDLGEAADAGELLTFEGTILGYGPPTGAVILGDLWQDGNTIVFQDNNPMVFN